MRYPNLRYGNPVELRYYAGFYGDSKTLIKNLAKSLRRDERTVKDWLNERKKVPWWVPELLRLRSMEHRDTVRQMTGHNLKHLAVVDSAGIYHLHTSAEVEARKRTPPPLTSLRLDDFDTDTRAPARKRKTPPAKPVHVSDEDIYNWVAAVSPVHLSDRSYARYVRQWDVAGKVRQAKIDGRFDAIIAERKPAFKSL